MEKDPIADYIEKKPGNAAKATFAAVNSYQTMSSAARKGKAPSGVAKAIFRAGKKAGPATMVAGAAIDTANLALNPQAREDAKRMVEQDAKRNPVVRMVKSGFDPINTGYGIAAQVKEMIDSGNAAKKSQKQYEAMMAERKNRQNRTLVSAPAFRK
jgi:hypothetical protein